VLKNTVDLEPAEVQEVAKEKLDALVLSYQHLDSLLDMAREGNPGENRCDFPLVGFPSVLLSISLMSLKGMASGACGYRVTSIAAAAAPAAWRVVPAGGGSHFHQQRGSCAQGLAPACCQPVRGGVELHEML
jgi:hypothetical protein